MFWRHPKLVSNWTQTWHFWGTVYILCWIERLFRYLSIRMQPVGNHLIQTWMFVTGARRNCCRENCPLILVKTCILQYTNKSTRICSECSYVPSPLLYINPFFFLKTRLRSSFIDHLHTVQIMHNYSRCIIWLTIDVFYGLWFFTPVPVL